MVAAIQALRAEEEPDSIYAWRLPRYWFVFGMQVRTICPISSSDYPMCLFSRQQVRFSGRSVDDRVVGYARSVRLPGFIYHDTLYSLYEVFSELNNHTTRLVKCQQTKPPLTRGVVSAIGVFFKWYLLNGAWRYGEVGVVTGLHATFYSFLRHFKA